MDRKDNTQSKKTPIEETGKIYLIEKLLNGSSNSLSDTISAEEQDNGHILVSHSLLLEGIDFDLVYTPLKHLGYKAVLSALGPIYAACHTPQTISVKIGLSGRFFTEDAEELWQGISAAIAEHKIETAGLDLLPSLTGLTLSLSSQGKQPKERFVQMPAPASGDLICITGSMGAAYMGLQLLEREKALFNSNPGVQPKLGDYKFILKSYLSPEINTTVPETMMNNNIFPSAGEFITRGLADSVKRVCRRSGLGARIFLDKLPIATQTFAMAEELNMDAITAALNGGDDMHLLYVIPLAKYEEFKKELPALDVIGHLSGAGTGTMLVTPDGSSIELKAQGWGD